MSCVVRNSGIARSADHRPWAAGALSFCVRPAANGTNCHYLLSTKRNIMIEKGKKIRSIDLFHLHTSQAQPPFLRRLPLLFVLFICLHFGGQRFFLLYLHNIMMREVTKKLSKTQKTSYNNNNNDLGISMLILAFSGIRISHRRTLRSCCWFLR